jgi:hypothetical protein
VDHDSERRLAYRKALDHVATKAISDASEVYAVTCSNKFPCYVPHLPIPFDESGIVSCVGLFPEVEDV